MSDPSESVQEIAALRHRLALLEELARFIGPTLAADGLRQEACISPETRNPNGDEDGEEMRGVGNTETTSNLTPQQHPAPAPTPAQGHEVSPSLISRVGNFFDRFSTRNAEATPTAPRTGSTAPHRPSGTRVGATDPFVTALLFDAVGRGDVAGMRAFKSVYGGGIGNNHNNDNGGTPTADGDVPPQIRWNANCTRAADPFQRTPLHVAALLLRRAEGRAVVHRSVNGGGPNLSVQALPNIVTLSTARVATSAPTASSAASASATAANASLAVTSVGLDVMRLLLEDMGADPNARDAEGRTALHYIVDVPTHPLGTVASAPTSVAASTAARSHVATNAEVEAACAQEAVVVEAIRLLRRHGADASAQEGTKRINTGPNPPPTDAAFRTPDPSDGSTPLRKGRTPLHLAALLGSLPNVAALLVDDNSPRPYKSAPFVDILDGDGLAALHNATFLNFSRIVTALLAAGADPSLPSGDHRYTPLHFACLKGYVSLLEPLADAGSDLSAHCKDGLTPFHLAAKKNKPNALKKVHELGCDVNMRCEGGGVLGVVGSGYTPLHVAAAYGCLESARMLVEELGADKEARADALFGLGKGSGKRPLAVARENHRSNVENYLESGMSYAQRLLY